MKRRIAARRARGDRGAVLVESAFVLPVFLLLVFGVIEWGLFFAGSATTTSSAREGSRFAAANFAVASDKQAAADAIRDVVQSDIKALTGQDTPISLFIYKADANGNPNTGNFSDCTANCYKYTWNGSSFVAVGGSPGWSNPSACLTVISNGVTTHPTLDVIGVYVQVNHAYVTGFLRTIVGATSTISEHATTRLEPLPQTQC
jgi:Flp pilus assembly protein TadG